MNTDTLISKSTKDYVNDLTSILSNEIEEALDEADYNAYNNTKRYTHDELFRIIRIKINR